MGYALLITRASCPKVKYTLKIDVTTGVSKDAQSGQHPHVTFVGTTGTFTGKINVAGKGKSKVTTFKPPKDLGKIKSVSFSASSKDGWLLTKARLKSGALPWQPFGCLPRWLDGKPYDKSPYDAPWGDKFTVKPGVCKTHLPTPMPTSAPTKTPTAAPTKEYKLKVRVTTGKVSYAESGQHPKVKLTFAGGKTYTGKIHCAKKGKSKVTTFKPKEDLGDVVSAYVKASGTDGWLLTKFEVKSGERPYKSFGCLPHWLDGKPYDKAPYKCPKGKECPYDDHFSLKVGECPAHYPANWGQRTKKGCFCKLGGGKNNCHMGANYHWCNTRNGCKGGGSGWDHCTMPH